MSAELERMWSAHNRRVFGVAYRMLGSVAEAEDVAQDAYARLLQADLQSIEDPEAWLVTVTSRICLDRLRSHEHSRRSYPGPWLPEPILGVDGDLADRVTLDESVRLALLVVLERLSPAERTAFVLHDVFGLTFDEVGEVVGRSAAACRQLASRARRRVAAGDGAARYEVDVTEHRRVAERFADACQAGDLGGLLDVLDPEVVGDFDSGGLLADAPLEELHGADAVAAQLQRVLFGVGASFVVDDVNGQPGVVVRFGSAVAAVIFFEVGDELVSVLRGIGNPTKLAHLGP